MTMMYKRIAAAIRDSNTEAHPTDYLQFFCLGKRQPPGCYTSLGSCEPSAPLMQANTGMRAGGSRKEPPQESQKQAACIKARRFMIYVHSKVGFRHWVGPIGCWC